MKNHLHKVVDLNQDYAFYFYLHRTPLFVRPSLLKGAWKFDIFSNFEIKSLNLLFTELSHNLNCKMLPLKHFKNSQSWNFLYHVYELYIYF